MLCLQFLPSTTFQLVLGGLEGVNACTGLFLLSFFLSVFLQFFGVEDRSEIEINLK